MNINGMQLVKGAALNKLIDGIRKKSGALADEIHLAAVSSLAEVFDEIQATGAPNVDRFRQLILNVHVSNRRKALGEWFKEFAPVSVVFDKDGGVSVKMLKGAQAKAHKGWQIEAAAARPYWDLTQEKVPGPVDFVRMLNNIQSKMGKALRGETESKQAPDSIERALVGMSAVLKSLEA